MKNASHCVTRLETAHLFARDSMAKKCKTAKFQALQIEQFANSAKKSRF
jgi:2-hydroxy-3-keto-5-methylthiopentenyl-1-phosphate phosphatase